MEKASHRPLFALWKDPETGEAIPQQLAVYVAEDPSCLPSTHVTKLTTTYTNSSSKVSNFGFRVCTRSHTHIYTHLAGCGGSHF